MTAVIAASFLVGFRYKVPGPLLLAWMDEIPIVSSGGADLKGWSEIWFVIGLRQMLKAAGWGSSELLPIGAATKVIPPSFTMTIPERRQPEQG